jgi:hypothetical protein
MELFVENDEQKQLREDYSDQKRAVSHYKDKEYASNENLESYKLNERFDMEAKTPIKTNSNSAYSTNNSILTPHKTNGKINLKEMRAKYKTRTYFENRNKQMEHFKFEKNETSNEQNANFEIEENKNKTITNSENPNVQKEILKEDKENLSHEAELPTCNPELDTHQTFQDLKNLIGQNSVPESKHVQFKLILKFGIPIWLLFFDTGNWMDEHINICLHEEKNRKNKVDDKFQTPEKDFEEGFEDLFGKNGSLMKDFF